MAHCRRPAAVVKKSGGARADIMVGGGELAMARKRLGEILIQAGVLDEARLNVALREQQRWGGPLGRKLIELHLIREEDLVQALAFQLNIPVAPELAGRPLPQATLDLLPL